MTTLVERHGPAAQGSSGKVPHFRVAIIGTGFAGLGAAIRLLGEGERDFVVFERASDVGGTWRDNTYPGCACDVPSHLYSFSFAPNPHWTHVYARQPEILRYLQETATRFGVRPHLRFRSEVLSAAWDNADAVWRIETRSGAYTASALISGHGPLVEPKWPEVKGLERFEGERFHSARWNHAYDLTGKRVAVIGTGASAIQFVPAIQPQVGRMFVFQRSAPWIVPRPDRPFTTREKWVFRRLPATQLAARAAIFARSELNALGFTNPTMERLGAKVARAHLEAQVGDPALRAKLTPNYRMGCKRILVSSDYYPALTRPNVELVTDAIAEVRERSIVTVDGRERAVDALICGTGFHVTDIPIAHRLRGVDGRSLAEVWNGSPQAYLGTTVHGFPNLFLLVGPNVGVGHTSIVYMIESQLPYVLGALRHLRRAHLLALNVKENVQRAYNVEVQARLQKTVWLTGGCGSWYLDQNGQNTTLWPGFAFNYRARLARFDPRAYTERLSPVPLKDRAPVAGRSS